MTYTIKFSDTTKASFTIEELKKDGPGSLDGSHTDLVLYGKGNSDYGEDLWNNLVHILENFSSAGPGPSNPIEGQLWYNKVDGILSVYKEIKPSTSPKTYTWSKIIDVQSLSNPAIINELLAGLATALSDPSNTSKTALLTALGDSYLQKSGGTLTGPLNINPYTTDAANDPLQNNNLAVSVSYLKSYVTNKLANLDLSTLIGFDIPPFDSTLDAGYGGYYIKKVLDSSIVDNTLAGAQIVQSNIILPSYNTEVVNAKFAASREYVDAKILEFSKTFIKKIIWTDTLSISNSLIRGTIMAKLPTGFNYIAAPTVTMSPALTDAVMVVNLNDTKDSLIISFTGQTTATRILSKLSIASSQITGIAGYIDSESLVYNLNTSSTALPTTTTTAVIASTTTTTTATFPTTTTTEAATTSTTAIPTTTTTAAQTPTLFEGGYWFGQDATYNYYISPTSLETPNRITYSDAVAYCNNLPVLGTASYKWQIPSVAEFTMLFNYKNNLSSVVAFNLAYWTTDADSNNYWKKIFSMADGSTTSFNPTNGAPDSNTMWTRPIRKVPK
jgi:hypothetical protein